MPLLIYVVALWGVGLGGGFVLGFDTAGVTPPSLLGAPGFWAASTAGLTVAALGLSAFLQWVLRQRQGEAAH